MKANITKTVMVRKFSAHLESGLKVLGMQEPSSKPNLKFVYELNGDDISYRERLFLERANRLGAHAVYFYNVDQDEGKKLPQVYIYDKENITKGLSLGDIHRNIWSSSEVKIFMVISKDEITIFDSSKPVTFKKNSEDIEPTIFETINIANKATEEYRKIEKYYAKNIDKGFFWKELEDSFSNKNSSYNLLLEELRNAKKEILKGFTDDSEKKLVKKLIIACIFIKYLEDRRDENARTVFPKSYFQDNYQSENFIDVIRKNKLPQLLEDLKKHFNGHVFKFVEDNKDAIDKLDKEVLIDFLSGEADGKQLLLWRKYSFQYLPIEFISAIYEDFIEESSKKKDGAFYTPPHIVNLMIDESMPLSAPRGQFKIIDPACGSGIFLVAGFRRLVDWWRILKYRSSKKWEKPSKENLDEIKKILATNIFGVDKAKEATDVAIFSLCLCLCDMLSPEEIWKDLTMVDLSSNIKTKDFFSYLTEQKQDNFSFDLVIGNPPFCEISKTECENIRKSFPSNTKTPSNQLALLFLELSVRLLKPETGSLCLLIQASSLIYNTAKTYINFRKSFFEKYKVLQILDFSKFERIFKHANVKVAAISLLNKPPSKNDIFTHITPQKLVSAEKGLYFEFSHYDFHRFPYSWSYLYPYIWKSNLMGGGRIFTLMKKFSEMKTLKDFISEKGWTFGEGYNKSKKPQYKDDEGIICGQPTIITRKFTTSNPNWKDIIKIYSENDKGFDAIRDKSRYTPPMLLIKESSFSKENGLVYGISEEYLTYAKEILGINANPCDIKDLKLLTKWIEKSKKIIYFHIMCGSAATGIRRSSTVITANNILSLPFSLDAKYHLSDSEKIILDDFDPEYKKNQEAKLSKEEIQTNLNNYAAAFVLDLNKLYSTGNKAYRLQDVKYSQYAILCSFKYTNQDCSSRFKEDIEMKFDGILNNSNGSSSQIGRITKIIDGDFIHILKPNKKMFWQRSIAFRDADSLITTLFEAGF